MGGKKKRITSKIDELPEDIRIKVVFCWQIQKQL